jgi:hypothetical protein
MSEVGRVFFAIVGVAITVALAAAIAGEVRRMRRARTWPMAAGHIVGSRLVWQAVEQQTTWRVHGYYEYRAGGAWQRGGAEVHVVPGTKGKAERTLENYPPGLGLQIAHNPERIEQSLLADEQRQRLHARKVGLLIVYAAIGVAWVWFLVVGLQR